MYRIVQYTQYNDTLANHKSNWYSRELNKLNIYDMNQITKSQDKNTTLNINTNGSLLKRQARNGLNQSYGPNYCVC